MILVSGNSEKLQSLSLQFFGKFSSWLKCMGMLISVKNELTWVILFHIQCFYNKLAFVRIIDLNQTKHSCAGSKFSPKRDFFIIIAFFLIGRVTNISDENGFYSCLFWLPLKSIIK